MQVHALETIANEGAQAFTKQTTPNIDVQQAARSLLAEFGDEKGKPVKLLVALALSGMTPDEYLQAEKAGYAMAAAIDKASGFVKVKGAKGSDAYGQKEATLRVQASARKKVFGVARLNVGAIVGIPDNGIVNPDTLPTMATAVKKAREYLDSHKLEWTGQPMDTDQQQQVKNENAAYKAARDAVEKANPVQPGETLADWMARIEPLIEVSMLSAEVEARKDKAAKIAKGLFDKHGAALAEQIMIELEALLYTPDPEPATM